MPATRRFLLGLRGRLLLFIVAASIPVIGLTGASAWSEFNRTLADARKDAELFRQAAAARHGAEMDVVEDKLRSLAGRTDLLAMPPEACDGALAAAQNLLSERYGVLWMLDSDGRMRCSARPAERGQDFSDRDYVREVQANRRPALGAFVVGSISRRPVIPYLMPMLGPDGSLRAMVGASVYLGYLVRTQRALPIADAHHVWLIDLAATVVTLTDAPDSALPDAAILHRIVAEGAQTFEAPARSGISHIWSVAVVEPGLRLVVSLPLDGIRRAANKALATHIIELALMLAIGIAVIILGVELSVVRPLRRVVKRVRRWSPGVAFRPQERSYDPPEVQDLDTALVAASSAIDHREAELQKALAQRDLMMEETNHRVHNNLQIIASLLSMQADSTRRVDVRAEFAVARDRVRALAILYRHLSVRTTPGRIALRPFIAELCRQLSQAERAAPESRVAMTVDVDAVEIAADQADSLTLLIAEAVSNAMQHAFPDDRTGTITVSLRQEGDVAILRIQDDGIGLPADAEAGPALGLKLIRGFASHLGGTVEIGGVGGTLVLLRFPILPNHPVAPGPAA